MVQLEEFLALLNSLGIRGLKKIKKLFNKELAKNKFFLNRERHPKTFFRYGIFKILDRKLCAITGLGLMLTSN